MQKRPALFKFIVAITLESFDAARCARQQRCANGFTAADGAESLRFGSFRSG
jgi:hypothetical protein